jgi:hypothetical protein
MWQFETNVVVAVVDAAVVVHAVNREVFPFQSVPVISNDSGN